MESDVGSSHRSIYCHLRGTLHLSVPYYFNAMSDCLKKTKTNTTTKNIHASKPAFDVWGANKLANERF